MIRSLLPSLLFLLLLASCVPQHKIVYVQSDAPDKETAYAIGTNKSLKIEPFDMLYISIGSANGEQNGYNFFNQDKQNYNSVSELSMSVLGYTVNDSGAITLPVIGKIHLQGLTLDQAAGLIRDSTKSVVSHPIVSVRFVNSAVTVLGEVGKAGTYSYPNERLTIFYALGLAGDITEYGNRKKVVLIRESKKVIHKYYLDLTRDDIFKSDYYYLRPNDVVYVEPLKVRRFGMKEYPFALVVSAVTSVFLVLYYVKK
jgi:polysaccharide export outer membrane protein